MNASIRIHMVSRIFYIIRNKCRLNKTRFVQILCLQHCWTKLIWSAHEHAHTHREKHILYGNIRKRETYEMEWNGKGSVLDVGKVYSQEQSNQMDYDTHHSHNTNPLCTSASVTAAPFYIFYKDFHFSPAILAIEYIHTRSLSISRTHRPLSFLFTHRAVFAVQCEFICSSFSTKHKMILNRIQMALPIRFWMGDQKKIDTHKHKHTYTNKQANASKKEDGRKRMREKVCVRTPSILHIWMCVAYIHFRATLKKHTK